MLYDNEDYQEEEKKKNSLTLWNEYRNLMLERDVRLPRRPVIRILANLKKMISEFGYERSERYVRYCVENWVRFCRIVGIKKRAEHPDIGLIFLHRYSGILLIDPEGEEGREWKKL